MGALFIFLFKRIIVINELHCYFIPIIDTHTTKSIKNNNLRRFLLSRYNLFLRGSM